MEFDISGFFFLLKSSYIFIVYGLTISSHPHNTTCSK